MEVQIQVLSLEGFNRIQNRDIRLPANGGRVESEKKVGHGGIAGQGQRKTSWENHKAQPSAPGCG